MLQYRRLFGDPCAFSVVTSWSLYTIVRTQSKKNGVLTPSSSNTSHSLSLGNSDYIYHLVLCEHIRDIDLLFKMVLCPIHFISDGPTIDLNFHQMRLLLSHRNFANLCMYQHADDLTILFDAFEVLCGGGFGASGGSSV